MVAASITFTQSAVSPGPGISMVGVGGALVTLTNADDTGVISWLWELLDTPLNSALAPVTLGTAASASFTPDTPDTPGCYRIKLTVQGADGSVACDVKNFAVPTTQGWILPPFRASAAELNFPGNTEGWESLLNTIFLGISGGSTDEKVKITAADTTTGYLDAKIVDGFGLAKTILNPGANEQYQLDVGANADGSILVNANDVQVGVLASDAQHGARGGATQHAVATTLAAGFMSAADKTKLDGIGIIARTLTVGLSGDVDYNSVKDAIDAAVLGGASTATPWLIEVFPGTYTESPMTLSAGVFVVGQTGGGRSAVIEAADANSDLITASGGGLAGARLQGVTNPANALLRCATPFSQVQLVDVSIRNCSTGLAISGGATVVCKGFSAVISGPGQAVTTGISLTGATSTLAVEGASFNVPAPFLPLYPGVNPIETAIFISEGRATLNFLSISDAYNVATATGLLVDSGGQVSLFSSVFLGNNNAIEIGAGGSNSQVIIQGAEFRSNAVNATISSATGTIFTSSAVDFINYTSVPGGSLSGLLQSFNQRDTILVGDVLYRYLTNEQVFIGEFLHDFGMTGVSDTGGVVTDAGGLNVDVTAGEGYSSTHLPDHDIATVSWGATAGISLTANSTNYIFYDASASAVVASLAAPSAEDILLAVVVTGGAAIRYLHTTRNSAHQQGWDLYEYLLTTRKIAWTSGLATVQGSTARKLDVGSGSWYRALELLSVVGGTDVSWSYYYAPGAATEIGGVSDLDITNYDNAGVLAAMTAGYYRADTVIITSDNRVSIIYGAAEFATQADAEATTNKAAMPNFLDPTGCYSALVVVQQGAGIASIIDIRPDPNAATAGGGGGAGVSVHAALSGLGADDHLQYLRTDGTRVMTGSLDVGGNNVTNVNLVDGVDVSAHAVRHQPGGADAIALANPVAIGTVNAGGVAASLTRSDHVHAHGSQTDGSLHAVAIAGGANGFMSGTDKTKLDALTVFGQNYQRQENFAQATTTGEDVVRLTLVTGALTGTFRVGWGCALNTNNKNCEANLYDSTAATELMIQEPKPSSDNPRVWQFAGGVVSLTLTGSSKTLQLRYGNIPTKTDDVLIKNAWIEFWRVA